MSAPTTLMLFRHYREIGCELLPKLITYKIPLYLPQERLLFGASQLYITFQSDLEIPKVVQFDSDKKCNGHQAYALELRQRFPDSKIPGSKLE